MALEGLHHITAITADAPRNVDFYARVLGLRLVKKTVNFDQPDVYHLYFGDERGTPGSILTFFEFPGAQLGEAGDGMVHTIQWRVASDEALDYWAARLADEDVATERADGGVLAFADFEGLRHELLVATVDDAPLAARGVTSAGTVHHVAWSAADDAELEAVRAQAMAAGARATEIIDRQYFHSVYFREPSGVLFELASRDIGFEYDEPLESLGEALKLPPQYEARREELERALTPLSNPRAKTTA
jgi:glyoxalase family protein